MFASNMQIHDMYCNTLNILQSQNSYFFMQLTHIYVTFYYSSAVLAMPNDFSFLRNPKNSSFSFVTIYKNMHLNECKLWSSHEHINCSNVMSCLLVISLLGLSNIYIVRSKSWSCFLLMSWYYITSTLRELDWILLDSMSWVTSGVFCRRHVF